MASQPFQVSKDENQQQQKIIFVFTAIVWFRNFAKNTSKGWLAFAKLKPHSLFISLLSMLKKAFYNVKIEK